MTKPVKVYASDRATLWCGDAAEVLPPIPKESVDLVVTDPPYGQKWQSGQRSKPFDQLKGDGTEQADRDVISSVISECVRVVGQNRHLYVFGPTDVMEGQKVSEAVALVWDKTTMSGGDLTSAWGSQHEPITFVVSKHRHGGEAGKSSVPTRLRKGTVLRFARPTGRKVRHPSEKPVPLLRELIESSSRMGETVIDPFAGIGSTGVAALLSGRQAILVEKDPRWIGLARKRLRATELLCDQMEGL